MKRSKVRDRVNKFVWIRDEFDGYCHIIWLPSKTYNGILPGSKCDILGAYLDKDGKLSFLISNPDDTEQDLVSFGDFPFSVQKQLYESWVSATM